LVAQMIEEDGDDLKLVAPYGTNFQIDLSSLCLDSWDRFHGKTETGVPFVFSLKAQNEFFNLLDEFDDEWIQWRGQKISTPSFYIDEPSVAESHFWQERYLQGTHGWDLGEP